MNTVIEVLECERDFVPAMEFAQLLICWDMKFSYSYHNGRAIFFITNLGNMQSKYSVMQWSNIESPEIKIKQLN